MGKQARIRLSVNDWNPVTVWLIPSEAESGSVGLRPSRTTGIEQASFLIPRQAGFALDEPMVSGAIIEPDIGSNRWYSIDEISYCVGTPCMSPTYEITCSFTYNDPEPDK